MERQINKIKSIFGLSLALAQARFKVKNEGTWLGVFWYLLEPLLLFLVILKIRSVAFSNADGNYPVYLFTGLLVLNFFIKSSSAGLNSIEINKGFIKNMKLSHESLVIAGILQVAFSHVFEFLILIGLIIIFGGAFVGLVFYPLIFVSFFLFVLGLSFLLAVARVYVKDVYNGWGVFTRLLLFATPIFYVVNEGSFIYKANLINPIFHYVNATRDVLINGVFPDLATLIALLMLPAVFLVLGLAVFRKYKSKFAEMV